MSNNDSGFLPFILGTLAFLMAIVLGIVCLLIINSSGGETGTQLAGENSSVGNANDANDADANAAKQKNRRSQKTRSNNADEMVVVRVDDEEYQKAEEQEREEISKLLDEADRLISQGRKRNPKRREGKILVLTDLPPEEKNRIWWEIAAIAEVDDEDAIRYTLTTVKARRIGKKYTTSVLEVFGLFREGAKASWRTPAPPEELDRESNDQ